MTARAREVIAASLCGMAHDPPSGRLACDGCILDTDRLLADLENEGLEVVERRELVAVRRARDEAEPLLMIATVGRGADPVEFNERVMAWITEHGREETP